MSLSQADRDALQAMVSDFDEVFRTGDWERGAKYLADDFKMVLPEQDPIVSPSAWVAFVQELPPVREFSHTVEDIGGAGDLAFVQASQSFAIEVDGEVERNTSRWLAVCRKQTDGSWQVTREVVNFEKPFVI